MRVILNSIDEKNDRFFLNPIVDRPFTRMRCSKVSLPNTITTAHPDEDMRFTTKQGVNTNNYIISLQDINASDGNFWATRINERLIQQGINDWFWRYDDNVGKFSAEFPTNNTDSITFTKECRIFGITKGEVITPVDSFISNVVNLVPYNHAYITCSISTEDCNASVGNDAVIAEIPHAGAFMERHLYENNSPYFLPITQKDALSSIEIGIIDDRGRDLKSRLRGASYLVVLELE